METKIRVAVADDVCAITEIYNQAVVMRCATADITPVSTESRLVWLQEHPSNQYPVFVALNMRSIVGWCSLSPYRPGRMALRYTAEISYYVHESCRGMGVGSRLIAHTLNECPKLGLKNIFAILLDINRDSTQILEKFGFEKWGHMPNVADFDGQECGQLYYGRRIAP